MASARGKKRVRAMRGCAKDVLSGHTLLYQAMQAADDGGGEVGDLRIESDYKNPTRKDGAWGTRQDAGATKEAPADASALLIPKYCSASLSGARLLERGVVFLLVNDQSVFGQGPL